MRLHTTPEVLGRGFHRSGWPAVLQQLSAHVTDQGMLFMDSAEIHLRNQEAQPIRVPWAGIFHLPPLQDTHPSIIAENLQQNELFHVYSQRRNAQASLNNLHIIITLSDYAAQFYSSQMPDKSVYSLKYPHEAILEHSGKRPKYLLHSGTFLKNSAILNQFPKPHKDQTKLLIFTEAIHSMRRYQFFMDFFDKRTGYDDVEHAQRLPHNAYDNVLQESIVIVEYMDCSASTTLVECIACNVPMVVNRHPAVVEYLGADYPLFYDSHEEIPDLITRWEEAVSYLHSMDKTDFNTAHFLGRLSYIVDKYGA
jgi:hypothetical protein